MTARATEEARVDSPTEAPPAQTTLSTKNTRVVGASTAGIRAVVTQFTALYLRTPAKLFRPSRFDYLAATRLMFQDLLKGKPYRFSTHSSPALLIGAVRAHGWLYIPKHVLPPLVLNSATGVILYTTYLASLQALSDKHAEPLAYPSPMDTFRAGFFAGCAQSLAAAPIDAIQARSSASEVLSGGVRNSTYWQYGLKKLQEIGVSGVFAGYSMSLVKESVGFAFYFSTFEFIKNQAFHRTVSVLHGYRRLKARVLFRQPPEPESPRQASRNHKFLQTTFILLAGASAAFVLLAIQYPLTKVQNIHLKRLELLDVAAQQAEPPKGASVLPLVAYFRNPRIKVYYQAYLDTVLHLDRTKLRSGLSWFGWGYRGFASNALTMIPATSVCLLVFEILRTRLADELEDTLA